MKLHVPELVFDAELLGAPFAPPSFEAHWAFVHGIHGVTLSASRRVLWDRMSGGRAPLERPPSIVVIVKSRRTGMTQLMGGGIAPACALLDWPHSPGEEPTILYLASDRVQGSIAYKRGVAAFQSKPLLAAEVMNVTASRIELRNGNVLEIGTADSAAVRGRTLIGAMIDEACYVAGLETLLAALRPALATTGGTLWLFSTPRGADGPVYDLHRRYFGVENPDVLVIEAHVEDFNPTIPRSFYEREIELGGVNAMAEWLCQFIAGLTSWADAPLIDGSMRSGPRDLPRLPTTPNGTPITYLAAIDASGGRGDAAAAAVAHLDDGRRIVVDAVRRWPSPHDPAIVAASVAEFLGGYGVTVAVADRYGAEMARSIYRTAGVMLMDAPDTRSDTYLRLLPLLTSGRVELPPMPELRTELLGLERRTRSGARDSVNHRPGAHDDVANAVALAVMAAASGPQPGDQMTDYTLCETSERFLTDGIYGDGFLSSPGDRFY